MTIHRTLFPTQKLCNAIKRESVKQKKKVAILVIDEDEEVHTDKRGKKVLKKEVALLQRVRHYNPTVEVILVQLGLKSYGLDKSAGKIKGETKPTHPKLITAAGKSATIHEKFAESVFKDEEGEELFKRLSEAGIEVLVVMGRYHDSCIRESINDSLERGYKVLTASTVVFGSRNGSEAWKDHMNLEWYE
jgi:nicotinamidase-related amidase